MRKLFLSIILLTGVALQAQEVQFGAKAGLNIASINGGNLQDLSSRTSFHFGGVAEIQITDKFSVQPEILYSAQGAKFKASEGLIETNVTWKLDYLNIPVMAKYYLADDFSLEAGPQIGFLLSSKADVELNDASVEQDINDVVKSTDFGLNFGLGYKLDNGLNFGARYNLGLSNMLKESSESSKNGVFQFSVGYNF
ncbi:porin family protein [Tenacibaculum xiamenense]|uniref:porin family protein n=1 Tax=Tenacibaculum xiamenense TaxID=1261553 RepID=UPI0038957B65